MTTFLMQSLSYASNHRQSIKWKQKKSATGKNNNLSKNSAKKTKEGKKREKPFAGYKIVFSQYQTDGSDSN